MENTAQSNISSNSKMQVEIAKVEQPRLLIFIQNSHKYFTQVLQQEQKSRHHLNEFTQRIQTRKFIFGAAIHELYSAQDKLKADVTKINEEFQILWDHHATLSKLSCSVDTTKAGRGQLPDLNSVEKSADNLTDLIGTFQTKLFDTIITPLDCLENDLQQLIFLDLAGITSWQQDAQIYGQPLMRQSPIPNPDGCFENFECSQCRPQIP